MSLLSDIAQSQRDACLEILKRASAAAAYLPANDPDIYDMLFINAFYAHSLELVLPVASSTGAGLEWASLLCSSLVDDGVYARGLLYQALRVASESELVTRNDAPRFASMLGTSGISDSDCVVAYLDYVGATGYSIWSSFHELWRAMLVEATNKGFAGYYWRSSDTFYFARSVEQGEEAALACEAMLDLLIHLQLHRCIPGQNWRWQVGVTLERGKLIGDIFIPSVGGPRAADGMKAAVDKIRGGGVILADEFFRNALPDQRRVDFEESLLQTKAMERPGKDRKIRWYYFKR